MRKLILFGLLLIAGAMYATDQPRSLGYSSVEVGSINFVPVNYAAFTATTEIPASSSYVTLNSTGGNLTLATKPTISTATSVGGSTAIKNGTYIIVTSTTNASKIILQDNASVSGTLLNLPNSATTEVITSSRPAAFIYNATTNRWNQVSPSNGTF